MAYRKQKLQNAMDSRSTLRHRLSGGQSPRKAHEGKQRLSKEQEDHLVAWIFVQESLGLAVTHQQVRELAERVIKASGDVQPLGKRRMEHFLQRNPKARTRKRGKPMDSTRVKIPTYSREQIINPDPVRDHPLSTISAAYLPNHLPKLSQKKRLLLWLVCPPSAIRCRTRGFEQVDSH
jgi:hypothetical protein